MTQDRVQWRTAVSDSAPFDWVETFNETSAANNEIGHWCAPTGRGTHAHLPICSSLEL